MTVHPSSATNQGAQSIIQLEPWNKELTIDSSWAEILSELHLIQDELSALKNGGKGNGKQLRQR